MSAVLERIQKSLFFAVSINWIKNNYYIVTRIIVVIASVAMVTKLETSDLQRSSWGGSHHRSPPLLCVNDGCDTTFFLFKFSADEITEITDPLRSVKLSFCLISDQNPNIFSLLSEKMKENPTIIRTGEAGTRSFLAFLLLKEWLEKKCKKKIKNCCILIFCWSADQFCD